MWFWGTVGLIAALGVAAGALYDRRLRKRRHQMRDPGDVERQIEQRSNWDAGSSGGGGTGF
jgi:hypothetical protein